MDPLGGLSAAGAVHGRILRYLNPYDLNELRKASSVLEACWPDSSIHLGIWGGNCQHNDLEDVMGNDDWERCNVTQEYKVRVRECQGPKYGSPAHKGKGREVCEVCRIKAAREFPTVFMAERMTPLCLDCAGEYRAQGGFRIGLCNCDMAPFADWLCQSCQDYFQAGLMQELDKRADRRRQLHLATHDKIDTGLARGDYGYIFGVQGNEADPYRELEIEQECRQHGTRHFRSQSRDDLVLYASASGFSCLCGKVQPWNDPRIESWYRDILMVCLCCYRICESPNGINIAGRSPYSPDWVQVNFPPVKAVHNPGSRTLLTIEQILQNKLEKVYSYKSKFEFENRLFQEAHGLSEFHTARFRPVYVPAEKYTTQGALYWSSRLAVQKQSHYSLRVLLAMAPSERHARQLLQRLLIRHIRALYRERIGMARGPSSWFDALAETMVYDSMKSVAELCQLVYPVEKLTGPRDADWAVEDVGSAERTLQVLVDETKESQAHLHNFYTPSSRPKPTYDDNDDDDDIIRSETASW